MTLIGALDPERATQLTDNVVGAIEQIQAEVVIIDVTGMFEIDTSEAVGVLLQSVEAARLLGAECILTGISPANAVTLTKAGIDLTDMTTKGSLRAGLNWAFKRINDLSG